MAFGSRQYAAFALLLSLAIQAAARQSYQQACRESNAGDPEFCISTLAKYGLEGMDVARGAPGRFELVSSALRASLDGVHEEIQMCQSYGGGTTTSSALTSSNDGELASSKFRKVAIDDCVELLTGASEMIGDSLGSSLRNASTSRLNDVHTWVSSALAYQTTCLDGLSQISPGQEVVFQLSQEGSKVGRRISTALAFIATLQSISPTSGTINDVSWVPELLKKKHKKAVTANVIVAQDGSGRYSTIKQAVEAAPSKSGSTYVIYIKAGTYRETVSVPKSKTNLMFVGDGIGKTIITGSKSVSDGVTTFRTSTVEINARGFLARDLTIRNTAGAAKHQAVALRVSADKVAFYKCSFEGYQDTLYTHVARQFYRECIVYGTVDFIFGDAAAVFQSCTLLARKPMAKQKNTITAQGRTDPNQNTGLSFQDCSVDGTQDLKGSGTPTYLGRPWKKYSRTVFLRCYMGSVVNPAGWLEWDGSFALKTLYYAEYQSKGPGSGTGNRVGWSSQMSSSVVANKFTAGSFISGSDWLGQTSFPYSLGI
ncbi:pectinesterase [Selaginella moellendorffii]|nr:pectinesterase [Selaginella moellendorffii]|eukprot:XP_002981054.2 pectinesterase [Selaginella moellendorffii]